MKKYLILFLIATGGVYLTSCGGGEKAKSDEKTKDSVVQKEVAADPDAGMTEGMNEIKYPDGQLKMKGEMVQGKRHGEWVSYYENGMKWSEDTYNLGARDGKCVSFYKNGQVRYIGYYTNNVKSGKWSFYDEQGNLTKEENFSE
ncbi:MAG: toxin-antitoxin system YwqK family antitoxin [Bacteroidota bacterium]